MLRVISTILRWIFSRTAMVFMLWFVVLSSVAIYLASRHYFDQLPEERKAYLLQLQNYQKQSAEIQSQMESLNREVQETLADLDKQMQGYRSQIAGQLEQTRSWEQKLRELGGVAGRATGVWDRLRGVDRDRERRQIQTRIREAQAEISEIRSQIRDLSLQKNEVTDNSTRELADLQTRSDAIHSEVEASQAEVDRIDARINTWEGRMDRGIYWLKDAYERVGRTLIIITLSILLAPFIIKVLLYYLWAPLIACGRPVIINTNAKAPVRVSITRVAQEIILQPGQRAVIQHKFYQASDEDLEKTTQFLFRWRYPFSSLSCGLFLLTQARNRSTKHTRRLTLSSQDEADVELAVVDIPENGSLICRPSFLAALVEEAEQKPDIRSHWRFFSLHSWITLQFRYFEFRGPTKLVLWAYRGVRAESLDVDNVSQGNERRTNQLATIGFSPSLHYKSRRSETFISYLRNQNPLFDDLFSGKGVFLCQQISRADYRKQSGKFWSQLWNGFTKILGI